MRPCGGGFEEDPRLVQPTLVHDGDRPADQGLDQDLWQQQPLGQSQRPLEWRGGSFGMAGEGAHTAELGERTSELAARLALLELSHRQFEPGRRLIQPTLTDVDICERCARAGCGPSIACLCVELERTLEPFPRLERAVRLHREPASLLEQLGLEHRVVGECSRLLVIAPTLFGRANRAGAYKRALAAGATSLREPTNEFYGDRMSGVQDPFGNQWYFATHFEDVADDEMARRAAELAQAEQGSG